MKLATKSFLRIEEYNALSKLLIDGKILDVGGSNMSGYHELIKGEHQIITGNIDIRYGADVEFDAQKNWPFKDSEFDGVLFVNVLEHLYGYKKAIEESNRVLKSGGIVAGVVPFMFNIHGSPNDYFRYTKSALENMFADAGFESIQVKELGSGGFSIIYHVLIGFVRWNWMARGLIWIFKNFDKAVFKLRPNNKMSAEFMPLGYYFEAKKK